MKKQISINNLIRLNNIINTLITDNVKFSFITGIKLMDIKVELEQLVADIMNNINTAIPSFNEKDDDDFTKDERVVYETIMNSVVEFDNHGITLCDLNNNCDPLPLDIIQILRLII